MKYLKRFDTEEEYQEYYEAELAWGNDKRPNLSMIVAENKSIVNAKLPPFVRVKLSDGSYSSVTFENGIIPTRYFVSKQISDIFIGEGITSISDSAFTYCHASSLTLSNTVENIGYYAFAYNSVSSVVIPNSVVSIGNNSFRSGGLTSIVLGNKLERIGNEAFMYCSKLTSIEIPDSVTSIGNETFAFCNQLSSVTFGNGITILPWRLFYQCYNLKHIHITSSITTINVPMFQQCNVSAITVDEANPIYDSRNNCNAIIETATNKLIRGCTNTIVPSNITEYGECAFFGSCSVEQLTIPSSVTKLGSQCFSDNPIKSVVMHNDVSKIGSSCFANNSSLTSVTLSEVLTQIPSNCFESCYNLSSITIPTSVVELGGFKGCYKLSSIDGLDNVKTVLAGAFSGCSAITSIELPSVETINSFAFTNCKYLRQVVVGSNLSYIDICAFENCTNLSSFKCYATSPPRLANAYVFDGDTRLKVYVPSSALEDYQRDTYWKRYALGPIEE